MSSRTHSAVRPVVEALSLFRQGIVLSSVLFVAHCVVGASLRVIQASSVISVFVVLPGPRHVSSRPLLIFSLSLSVSCSRFSVALEVLFSPLWRARSGSVCDLRCSCPPRRPTCIGFRGYWSPADWDFDRQVRTLRAFLGSGFGAASRRSGGDTIESISNFCLCCPPFAGETDVLTLRSKIMIV